MNIAENFLDELTEGILAAHPGELTTVAGDLRCMVNKNKTADKVGIATGGGSGHLPLFLGYIGEGMLAFKAGTPCKSVRWGLNKAYQQINETPRSNPTCNKSCTERFSQPPEASFT